MPVVVRELVIRARVEEVENNASGSRSAIGGSQGSALSDGQIERIIAICVERTLDAIQRKKER